MVEVPGHDPVGHCLGVVWAALGLRPGDWMGRWRGLSHVTSRGIGVSLSNIIDGTESYGNDQELVHIHLYIRA